MTHAFVLRSPVAHAHIKRIDPAAARRMPGVLFVATGEDVRADGLGDVPCMVPLVNRDGMPRHDTPRPVLALGKVRHIARSAQSFGYDQRDWLTDGSTRRDALSSAKARSSLRTLRHSR